MLEKILEMMVSGAVGNFTYDRLRVLLRAPDPVPDSLGDSSDDNSNDTDVKEVCGANIYYKNNYRVFDIVHDFYDVIELIKKPVVHIVIEDQPSTFWHLPLVVIEDIESGEWYVFSKGRLALEGSGGGMRNTKDLFRYLMERNIRFSGWVMDFVKSEKLSQGCLTWPSVRNDCLPIISYKGNQYFSDFIIKSFSDLCKNS